MTSFTQIVQCNGRKAVVEDRGFKLGLGLKLRLGLGHKFPLKALGFAVKEREKTHKRMTVITIV